MVLALPKQFSFSLRLLAFSLAIWALSLSGTAAVPTPQGRISVVYWEKWTGREKEAMQAIVNDFNASQDRIWVEMVSTANIDRKTLIATGGGVPPDVAGLWDHNLASFAEKNALLPLDPWLSKSNRLLKKCPPRALC